MKPFLRRGFLALAIMLALAVPANSEPFEDGKAAYERGDYATALRLLRPLAALRHADAQHNLGNMYRKGEGVPQDFAEAATWHRKAADQGLANAEFSLGIIYANGTGVPQDILMAHMWFSLAAASGLESARENLDPVARAMPPDQITEAQRIIREWQAKHQQ